MSTEIERITSMLQSIEGNINVLSNLVDECERSIKHIKVALGMVE